MITSGVQSITTLAPFTVPVAKSGIIGVALYNESPYAFACVYGGSQQTVPPWTGDLLHVAPLIGWDGNIQITPNTVTGSAFFELGGAYYYNAYGTGELIPAGFPIPLSRQQSISNQPRVISVPITTGVGQPTTGTVATPATGASVAIGTQYGLSGFTGGTFQAYIYYCYLSAQATPAAGGITIALQLDLQNASNVSLGGGFPIEFFRFEYLWSGTSGPSAWTPFAPQWPVYIVGTNLPATAHHAVVLLADIAGTQLPANLHYTIAGNLGMVAAAGQSVSADGPIGLPGTGTSLF